MLAKFKVTFIVCLITLLGFMGGSVYIAALPELSQVFHVSSAFVKFSITIYLIGFLVGTLLSAPLSEIYGHLKTLKFFLLLSIVASLVCGFSFSISWFLGGRFFEGIGHAGAPILIMAFIAKRYEGEVYHKFMSYIMIIVGLGPSIAPTFGSVILYFFEWRVIFYLFALLETVAFGFVCYAKIKRFVEQQEIPRLADKYSFFMMHPLFRYYCLMIGALYGAFYAFMVISPYIFRLHYDWRMIDFAWVGIARVFSIFLGFILKTYFIGARESKKIIVSGLFLITISLVLLSLIGLPSAGGVWFLSMVVLFMMGDSLIVTCLTEDAAKMKSQFANVAFSLISLSKSLLAAMVLLLVPFVPDTLMVINFFILGALVICIGGYLKIRPALLTPSKEKSSREHL